MPVPDQPVDGFILVGGGSRRFGSDKALALLGGRTLFDRAAGLLRASGIPLRAVGAQVRPYGILDAEWLLGERPGMGPVEGVRVCLAASRRWALILAVDMPWVHAAMIDALFRSSDRSPGSAVHCFCDAAGRLHPFPGIYHRSLSDLLARPEAPTSMHALLDQAPREVLRSADVERGFDLDRALRNANRPGDLLSGI